MINRRQLLYLDQCQLVALALLTILAMTQHGLMAGTLTTSSQARLPPLADTASLERLRQLCDGLPADQSTALFQWLSSVLTVQDCVSSRDPYYQLRLLRATLDQQVLQLDHPAIEYVRKKLRDRIKHFETAKLGGNPRPESVFTLDGPEVGVGEGVGTIQLGSSRPGLTEAYVQILAGTAVLDVFHLKCSPVGEAVAVVNKVAGFAREPIATMFHLPAELPASAPTDRLLLADSTSANESGSRLNVILAIDERFVLARQTFSPKDPGLRKQIIDSLIARLAESRGEPHITVIPELQENGLTASTVLVDWPAETSPNDTRATLVTAGAASETIASLYAIAIDGWVVRPVWVSRNDKGLATVFSMLDSVSQLGDRFGTVMISMEQTPESTRRPPAPVVVAPDGTTLEPFNRSFNCMFAYAGLSALSRDAKGTWFSEFLELCYRQSLGLDPFGDGSPAQVLARGIHDLKSRPMVLFYPGWNDSWQHVDLQFPGGTRVRMPVGDLRAPGGRVRLLEPQIVRTMSDAMTGVPTIDPDLRVQHRSLDGKLQELREAAEVSVRAEQTRIQKEEDDRKESERQAKQRQAESLLGP